MRWFALGILILNVSFTQAQNDCVAQPPKASEPVSTYDARVQSIRSRIANAQDNDAARNDLTQVTLDIALEIERLESLGLFSDINVLLGYIENNLSDTAWRTGYHAKQGDASAQAAQGLFHRVGVLAEVDIDRSCEFYAMAAAQGLPAAQFHHAICISQEQRIEGRKMVAAAADAGHAGAQLTYAMLCEEEKGNGDRCILEYLCKSAVQGRARAAGMAGYMFMSGNGVTLDYQKAFQLLSFAAERDEFAAQSKLGHLLTKGLHGQQDLEQAAHWYERSAEGGFPAGQFAWAMVLINGEGVPKDETQGRYWMNQAAQRGSLPAKEWLADNP